MTAPEKEEKFLHAVIGALYCVSILGNVQTGDYELIDADKMPLLEETAQNLRGRGFAFLGVIGFHGENAVRIALDEVLDEQAISQISVRFLKQLECELNRRVIERETKRIADAAEAVEWIKRLHALPDLRVQN